MKNVFSLLGISTLLLFFSCKKNSLTWTLQKIPTLATISTSPSSAVSLTAANSGGNITSDGGSTIISRGVCWSTNSNPTILDSITNDGNGIGSFNSRIAGLKENTTYFVRAYAVNSVGTSYGEQLSFFTIIIGAPYQGGILAYILDKNDPGYSTILPHGLIAAPYDQSSGIAWSNGSNSIAGATGVVLGTGQSNTNIIVSNLGNGNYAAKLCYDLELGGYNDWYLPSKDELNKLYLNQTNIGGFAFGFLYWSSSEVSSNEAWGHIFTVGLQGKSYKYTSQSVRAVRSF